LQHKSLHQYMSEIKFIGMNSEQFSKLFPCFLLLNEHLEIIEHGEAIFKYLPTSNTRFFYDLFTIENHQIEFEDYITLIGLDNTEVQVASKNRELLFTGKLIHLSETKQVLLTLNINQKVYEKNQNDTKFFNQQSLDSLIESSNINELILNKFFKISYETQIGLIITDSIGRIEWVNNAFETVSGYTLSEVLRKTPGSILQGNATEKETVHYLRNSILNGVPFECEILNYTKKKIPYWNKISGKPIYDSHGNVIHYFAFQEDITNRKKAEFALEEQRRFYEDILNNIPSDIAVFDKEHRYLFVNPVAIKDKQLRQWMIGKKDEEYFILKNKDVSLVNGRRKLFNDVIASKQPISWEEEIITRDGNKEYHLRKMFPAIDDEGEAKFLIGYGVNITERKIIEQAVITNEKRYRDLFNYSQALICTHDLNGKMLSVNPALCETIGYEASELLNHFLYEFIPEIDKPKFFSSYLNRIISGEKTGRVFRAMHKNGKVIFLLYQNYLVSQTDEEPYIIGFSQDITERIKAEQELLIAKKLTEESARAKETFLANVSHEIRTPMHGIMGISGLLAQTQLDDKQKNYVNLIIDSANNLVVIVNDILDIEKIASGKLHFESIDFVLADKLNTTVQSFQYKAEEKEIELQLACQFNNNLSISGDPYRLSQILNNLISNALKFTKRGKITVTGSVLFEDQEKILFNCKVTDTGIGIEKDKLDIIFNPFIQASSDTTRKYGGTGLGLSICKSLVEMQGGNIEVLSEENKGTTFSFSIPFKKVITQPVLSNYPIDSKINIQSFVYKKILMAEDVEVNQFLGRVILEESGFAVDIANNGTEAIELHVLNDYDLILMDIQMPIMDGIEATKAIRKMDDTKKASIPIIALTANALIGHEQKYIDAGMNASLTKPFTENKLFAAINSILNTTYILH